MTPLLVLDFTGTFVFALMGAFRALKYQLDILGVLILAVFTGLGGGIIRDLILDRTPPLAFQNEVYFLICAAAALLTIFWGAPIAKFWVGVKIIDAVGLAVFSVQGALLAWNADYGPVGVIFLGTLTAVGGGVLRDLLVQEMPTILIREVYATAAAAGALMVYVLKFSGVNDTWALSLGIAATFGLRLAGFLLKWELPRVKRLPEEPSKMARGLKGGGRSAEALPPQEKPGSGP